MKVEKRGTQADAVINKGDGKWTEMPIWLIEMMHDGDIYLDADGDTFIVSTLHGEQPVMRHSVLVMQTDGAAVPFETFNDFDAAYRIV